MSVYQKLSEVQYELKAPKTEFNSFGKYNYRTVESILEAVKPLLTKVKASIVISDDLVELSTGRTYVKATARFIDTESGESIEATSFAREAEQKRGMDESQITGSTSSYARKYALNGLLAIDDTKDTDSCEYIEEGKNKLQDSIDERVTDLKLINKVLETLKKNNIDFDIVCKLYKVKDLRKLTENQCENILDNIEKIKEAQEKENKTNE